MTFWKVSDTKMNCLITQEEIETLGFHIEELMSNRERTTELLDLLAMKGKEALGMDLQMGVQSFYGAFLPDRSLLLSITCGAAEGDVKVPAEQESCDVFQRLLSEQSGEEGGILSYQILFSSIDSVIDFCSQVYLSKDPEALCPDGMPDGSRHGGSRLYEYDGLYYLVMDFENTEKGRAEALKIAMAGEFGGIVEELAISEVFLQEHECCLIEKDAVEKLYKLEYPETVVI